MSTRSIILSRSRCCFNKIAQRRSRALNRTVVQERLGLSSINQGVIDSNIKMNMNYRSIGWVMVLATTKR